jgi:hypothetical protein
MTTPPAGATGLLLRFGPQDDALVGDLVEEYRSGRSRAWYWRQVLAAVALGAGRQVRAEPVRALRTLVTGWATLLVLFVAFGDMTAEGVAGWVWNWDRPSAYATEVWWPFQIAAVAVSYTGFALSALAVVRLQRRDAGPMLVAYAASVVVVLAASAGLIEVLTRQYGNLAVPHALFYAVSVTLPYQWRSGLVLAPMIVLVAGFIGCRRSSVQVTSGP